MSTIAIISIVLGIIIVIGIIAYAIVNVGKQPEDRPNEEDLYIAKNAILGWIYSCNEVTHLELCRQAVDTFLVDRFVDHIEPDVFGKVMYQVNAAMTHIRKSLA